MVKPREWEELRLWFDQRPHPLNARGVKADKPPNL